MSAPGSSSLGTSNVPSEFQLSQEQPALNLPCRSLFPNKPNPDFVGRSSVLANIWESLGPTTPPRGAQSVFALCGLGGVGKTQVAIHFATERLRDYEVVLFARADNRTTMLDDFSRFAAELGLVKQGTVNQRQSSETLKKWFEKTDLPWLLVFDNADNSSAAVLDDFWPRCDHGSVLVTSRVENLASELGGEVIESLPQDDAIELLFRLAKLSRSPDNQSHTHLNVAASLNPDQGSSRRGATLDEERAAVDIVNRLGCLPLGIYQGANLILNTSCSLVDFLSQYNNYRTLVDDHNGALISGPNEGVYRHTLSTVWTMNFESLHQDSQTLLYVLSFFNPDSIPLEMLLSGAAKAYQAGVTKWSIANNMENLTKCKEGMLHSSLVSQNSEAATLSMHRLVQEACHHRLIPETRQAVFDMALSLIVHEWPVAPRNNRHDPELWPKQQSLLPHVSCLCRFYEHSQQDTVPLTATKDFAELLYNASWYTYERGIFENSEPLLRVAEAYCSGRNGCEIILADIFGARASIANQVNRRKEGLENFELQWEYIKEAKARGLLTEPDIRICFALGGLGNGNFGLNNYQEAEQWYRQCLESWKGVTGDQRIYAGSLISCLIYQGRLEEASELLKPFLQDQTSTELRNGFMMYTLGNLQIAQGDTEAAFKAHAHVLKVFKLNLGERHHKTADMYYKIGWHYHCRREYPQALEMLNQALMVFEEHPQWYRNEISRTKYKLGCVHQDMGGFDEGTRLIREAEALRKEILGSNVPDGDEGNFDELVMFWSR
ncbi:hypothetical protein O1611_g931 [Lasiodiplodia mahajangana]|uniref:Uncharacterized protein n=1 Tax=Lasiodiplodia mahajangana TaxID=1108764 RepID=A0ACC2JYT5_9PEZI|nr:hypothetical protein O1611_g931 [Lasiodiplodia mahajangana]